MSRVDEIRSMVAFAGYSPEDLEDIRFLLGRVEKLEGLLNRLVAAADDSETDFEDLGKFAWTHLAEARTLLADESEENEHGNK